MFYQKLCRLVGSKKVSQGLLILFAITIVLVLWILFKVNPFWIFHTLFKSTSFPVSNLSYTPKMILERRPHLLDIMVPKMVRLISHISISWWICIVIPIVNGDDENCDVEHEKIEGNVKEYLCLCEIYYNVLIILFVFISKRVEGKQKEANIPFIFNGVILSLYSMKI